MLPCTRVLLNNSIWWMGAGKSGENPAQCRYCEDRTNRALDLSQSTDRPPKQAATLHGEGFDARDENPDIPVQYTKAAVPFGAAFLLQNPYSILASLRSGVW